MHAVTEFLPTCVAITAQGLVGPKNFKRTTRDKRLVRLLLFTFPSHPMLPIVTDAIFGCAGRGWGLAIRPFSFEDQPCLAVTLVVDDGEETVTMSPIVFVRLVADLMAADRLFALRREAVPEGTYSAEVEDCHGFYRLELRQGPIVDGATVEEITLYDRSDAKPLVRLTGEIADSFLDAANIVLERLVDSLQDSVGESTTEARPGSAARSARKDKTG